MDSRVRIKVAGQYVDIDFTDTQLKREFDNYPPFAEFLVEESEGREALFCLEICKLLPYSDCKKKLIGSFPVECSKTISNVYSFNDGDFYQIDHFINGDAYSSIIYDRNNRKAFATIVPNNVFTEKRAVWGVIVNALDYFQIKARSIFIHAAVVEYANRGYVFLGKSGTGKSTHAALWCKHINGATLLNDDAPIISYDKDTNLVSGSPWSGKTPCYRNKTVEIGAIVQLHQAKTNRIVRVSPLRAMALLLPCIVGNMKWDEEIHGNVVAVIEKLVQRTPVYEMWCTPDKEAAIMAYSKIKIPNNE